MDLFGEWGRSKGVDDLANTPPNTPSLKGTARGKVEGGCQRPVLWKTRNIIKRPNICGNVEEEREKNADHFFQNYIILNYLVNLEHAY